LFEKAYALVGRAIEQFNLTLTRERPVLIKQAYS
jgi:hypothetical protein